jgi:3-phenylpropionate/trans-cinnamate dioxygenase ferredoxin reductase subunit
MLKPETFYEANDITLCLSTRVVRIDRAGRAVILEDGRALPYHTLILATGARARRMPLPGFDLGGVLALRTAADAEALKQALGPGRRLAVIGGGYIGLEAAASARALGSEVVVIEREPRVLARVACETLSSFFHDYHRRHGVHFILGAGVEGIVGGDGRAAAVKLAGGTLVEADAFLVGVGAVPNQELAVEAGLRCNDGIVVDLRAGTADPAVFAIGDCTRRPMPLYGGHMHRLESVPNALEQAKQVASAITGRPAPPAEVPWFWSDQYDLKLQIAGVPLGAVRTVIRGDVDQARFAVFHLDAEDRIRAVEAINAAPEFMAGRLMIGQGKAVKPDRLRDMSVSMKEVAA